MRKEWLSAKTFIFVGLLAAVMTLGPRFLVMWQDDFTVAGSQKVFVYGFPFRVVDCALQQSIYMSGRQAAVRLMGNFTVFFIAGLSIAWMTRRIR